MNNSVFISYRRDDSADIAGRIYDRLSAKFGKNAVFKDVDSIPLGVNFKKILEDAVQQCVVELVVIGKQWLDIADEHGKRRLDDPRDYVRIEIEAALSRDIPVIPLLVSGALMPPEDCLPPGMVELAYRNGTEVGRDPHFHRDMNRVIEEIEERLTGNSSPEIVTQNDQDLEASGIMIRDVDVGKIDTIVVPAHEDGFRRVFLGKNAWYAIRIHRMLLSQIKYIAVYQTRPISAITYIAPVSSIEPWEDSGKFIVKFSEPAHPIGPIRLVENGRVKAPQNIRYTTLQRLEEAKTLDEVW